MPEWEEPPEMTYRGLVKDGSRWFAHYVNEGGYGIYLTIEDIEATRPLLQNPDKAIQDLKNPEKKGVIK
jgi:hypothetical protein